MKNFNIKKLKEIKGDIFNLKVPYEDEVGNQKELRVKLSLKDVFEGTNNDKYESFTAIFEGSKEQQFPQGTYEVSHDRLGEMSLFFCPNSEVEYEVVVNRERD